jgi:hypothetical protein
MERSLYKRLAGSIDSNFEVYTDVDGDSCAAVAAEFVLETTSIGKGAIAVHLLPVRCGSGIGDGGVEMLQE